jgi:transcriptional regulator with XRE-family HTH domain
MSKRYRTIPAAEVFADFTPAEQAQVGKRTEELLAEEFALRDLRRSKQLTQAEVAGRLGGRQVYVSRLEKRADMKLSTLREFVGAIGGDLHLMVTFPEGKAVRLKEIGETAKASSRPRRKPEAITALRAVKAGR